MGLEDTQPIQGVSGLRLCVLCPPHHHPVRSSAPFHQAWLGWHGWYGSLDTRTVLPTSRHSNGSSPALSFLGRVPRALASRPGNVRGYPGCQTSLKTRRLGCITLGFFSNKINRNSFYGFPEQNINPKFFFFFWPRPCVALGVRKYIF